MKKRLCQFIFAASLVAGYFSPLSAQAGLPADKVSASIQDGCTLTHPPATQQAADLYASYFNNTFPQVRSQLLYQLLFYGCDHGEHEILSEIINGDQASVEAKVFYENIQQKLKFKLVTESGQQSWLIESFKTVPQE